jgi:CDP-glycerol glycerophosphotransferase
VRDGRLAVPESAIPVRADSVGYVDALARSRYVVADGYLPDMLRRRADQTVVQTWHGGMLKRHGVELASLAGARRAHRRVLGQDPSTWQYLVSPSASMTPVLRRAFPFAGEVLETGLPRADLLRRADAAAAADDVRRRLDIPAGKRLMLYAPTYRDHLRQGRTRYRLGQTLDLESMRRALGDDWVILFRRHRDVVGRLAPAGDGFVRDVSGHPTPTDLLLAADVLVTDYSSLVFDQVSLGRPVVFFVPDVEAYRDRVRGFAIPFEDEAPGPLLPSTDAVVEALRDLGGVRSAYEQRFAAFASTYCPLDDGAAAARVVDAVFGR